MESKIPVGTTIINIASTRVHRQAPLRHEPIGETRDIQRQRVRLTVTKPGDYVLEAAWRPEGLATSPDRRRPKVAEPWFVIREAGVGAISGNGDT